MDLLGRIPSGTETGMTAAADTHEFDARHQTFDKARLLQGGKGIVNGSKLGLNNKDRSLLTKLILMPDDQEQRLDNVMIADYFKNDRICSKLISGTCGRPPLPSGFNLQPGTPALHASNDL